MMIKYMWTKIKVSAETIEREIISRRIVLCELFFSVSLKVYHSCFCIYRGNVGSGKMCIYNFCNMFYAPHAVYIERELAHTGMEKKNYKQVFMQKINSGKKTRILIDIHININNNILFDLKLNAFINSKNDRAKSYTDDDDDDVWEIVKSIFVYKYKFVYSTTRNHI